jgi:glucans biosynthesis protein
LNLLSRRHLLGAGLGWAGFAFPANASPPISTSHTRRADGAFDEFASRARVLSRRAYAPVETALPAPFAALDYDGYRRLRPRSERAIFRDSRFAVLPLPRGFLFRDSVALSVMDADGVRRLESGEPFVDFVDYPQAGAAARAQLGMSGWRLLERTGPNAMREMAVFQGGVYFRAVADHLSYGISGRALALNTAGSQPEEFPHFREFCILEPRAGDAGVRAVALLESASVAGAYQFDISPGAETVMDVRASLFPRVALDEVGLGAMSSMFARGPADARLADRRPEVHDSDGLAVDLGNGERLWRPLTNPHSTQISAFRTATLRGFGLLQRQRAPEAYRDSEARYESRPSLWVTPGGDWGDGHVMLTELPTANEYNDNVVAFWRPASAWRAGGQYDLRYRLTWNRAGPAPDARARVIGTRVEGARFVIDFSGAAARDADVWASRGVIADQTLAQPAPDRAQLSFTLDAPPGAPVELRAALKSAAGAPLSETWLFRWTHD